MIKLDSWKGANLKAILKAVGVFAVILAAMWLFSANRALKAENKALQARGQQLELALTQERDAAKAHDADRAAIEQENDALRKELSDVYANDKAAADWANEPCPDSVLCRLRFQE